MARPPNKSGLGPQNDLGGMDFASLGERAQRITVQNLKNTVRVGNLTNDINLIDEALGLVAPGTAEEAAFISRKTKLQNRIENISSQLTIQNAAQVGRISDLTQSQIAAAYSSRSVNGQVMQVSRTSTAMNASVSMQGAPWESLEQRKNQAQNIISSLGQQATALSTSLYDRETGEQDPAKIARLRQLEARRNVAVNAMGETEAAMRTQRALGLDPQSKWTDLLKVGDRAQGMLNSASIASEMREGGGVNISRGGKAVSISGNNIQSTLDTEARTLVDALRKLQSGIDPLSDAFKKLKAEAEEAGGNIEKLKEAAGSGGGGASTSSRMAALAGGFGAAAGASQEILVNQRLRQVGNIAGLANIENQKYDTYRTAAGGNIMSQMQLSQYAAAEGFGGSLASGQTTTNILGLAGSAAQTAAGYFQAVEGGAQKNPLSWAVSGVMGNAGSATNEVQQGILGAAQGMAGATVTGADMARGISTTTARIQATQSYMEATKALSYVGAEQLQGFRDMGVGLSVAAQGMGRGGGAFLDRTISKDNINRMITDRISPEQMMKMSQLGVQTMGSRFNEDQIFAARGAERSGMGTMQENMQRMATLASAGSNNPREGLGSVLEAAVSKGLDASKALGIVADNTAAMVETSTGRAMGFDTTAAAAGIVTAAVNKGDPNQEFAAKRAMTVAENLRGVGTDVGMNFAAMAATSRIMKDTGLSGTQAIIAQGFDDTTLRAMRGQDPNKLKESLRMRGINATSGANAQQLVEQLIEDRMVTTFTGGAAGIATGASQYAARFAKEAYRDPRAVERLIRAQKSGRYGSADEEQFMRAASEQAGLKGMGVDEYLRGAVGIASQREPNAHKSGTETQGTLDDMRTQGFKQLSQAALEATRGFKTATETVKALGILAKRVERIGDNGGEGKFKGAAADSAESFGKSTMKFEHSVDVFSAAAQILASKAGLREDDPHLNRETKNRKIPSHKMSAGQRG